MNAVRASGNLLKILNLEGTKYKNLFLCIIYCFLLHVVLSNNVGHVTIMCSLLTDAVNNGGMKTRWNACYACHNALSNECFTSHYKQCIVCKNIHVCMMIYRNVLLYFTCAYFYRVPC